MNPNRYVPQTWLNEKEDMVSDHSESDKVLIFYIYIYKPVIISVAVKTKDKQICLYVCLCVRPHAVSST